MRKDIGYVGRVQDYFLAKATVESIRLLTKREMQWLFPEGKVYSEKFGLWTKSIVAWRALTEAHNDFDHR